MKPPTAAPTTANAPRPIHKPLPPDAAGAGVRLGARASAAGDDAAAARVADDAAAEASGSKLEVDGAVPKLTAGTRGFSTVACPSAALATRPRSARRSAMLWVRSSGLTRSARSIASRKRGL